MINREAIYSAVLDKLSSIADFKIKSRRIKHWSDVAPADFPCFFLNQRFESAEQEKKLPTKWTLSIDLVIYVHSGGDHNVIVSSLINALVDKIELALKPNPLTGYTTLDIPGVSHCWIGGPIEHDEGVLGDIGVVIVPLDILAI